MVETPDLWFALLRLILREVLREVRCRDPKVKRVNNRKSSLHVKLQGYNTEKSAQHKRFNCFGCVSAKSFLYFMEMKCRFHYLRNCCSPASLRAANTNSLFIPHTYKHSWCVYVWEGGSTSSPNTRKGFLLWRLLFFWSCLIFIYNAN